jgi:hypothetical protein
VCDKVEFECWDKASDGVRPDWNETACYDGIIDYCCKVNTMCEQFETLDYSACEALAFPTIINATYYWGHKQLWVEFDKPVRVHPVTPEEAKLDNATASSLNFNCSEILSNETMPFLGEHSSCWQQYEDIIVIAPEHELLLNETYTLAFLEVL